MVDPKLINKVVALIVDHGKKECSGCSSEVERAFESGEFSFDFCPECYRRTGGECYYVAIFDEFYSFIPFQLVDRSFKDKKSELGKNFYIKNLEGKEVSNPGSVSFYAGADKKQVFYIDL